MNTFPVSGVEQRGTQQKSQRPDCARRWRTWHWFRLRQRRRHQRHDGAAVAGEGSVPTTGRRHRASAHAAGAVVHQHRLRQAGLLRARGGESAALALLPPLLGTVGGGGCLLASQQHARLSQGRICLRTDTVCLLTSQQHARLSQGRICLRTDTVCLLTSQQHASLSQGRI